MHNETVNAWTTLLSILFGFILFADAANCLNCSWLDFSPFLVAWAGQTLHGPLSCGYHTFMCMSPAVANRWRKLDLTFILVLNTCATYAMSYYTFGLWVSLVWTAAVGGAAAVGIRSVQALKPKQQLDRRRILGTVGLTSIGYYLPVTARGLVALAMQGFSHNLMHILCFTAFNCAYPYLKHLHSQREEWAALWAPGGAR
ncbi:hypothetical protein TSOC_005065 [Tetrabaena socialis]|uniref:Post-GPI attachment to proteins factor 3 n=1 Tax=Tetrabaena socialis TaxID=47790 RepID=A0A2J8A768_9CHLO|nr:hypothetical protein TSOC_005065 [Tetrabaena socialis]|eukprot:PNH08340.1 hypothetical protein TSOC_005065 [Tetrabaena socialis]